MISQPMKSIFVLFPGDPLLRHHSAHFRHKMAEVWDLHPHYEIEAFGQKFVLDLTYNYKFVSPGLHVGIVDLRFYISWGYYWLFFSFVCFLFFFPFLFFSFPYLPFPCLLFRSFHFPSFSFLAFIILPFRLYPFVSVSFLPSVIAFLPSILI